MRREAIIRELPYGYWPYEIRGSSRGKRRHPNLKEASIPGPFLQPFLFQRKRVN